MNETLPLSAWLWNELHDLFDIDDRSLPEIRVNYSDAKAGAQGYAILSDRASVTSTKDATFWSITDDREYPLDSVPNAAVLVASGEAEPFHVVFSGLQSRGIMIPNLGVFVFSDQLALDYRMGVAWGAAEIDALFALLSDLCALDPQASLSLEDGTLPAVVKRFQDAWHRYDESYLA